MPESKINSILRNLDVAFALITFTGIIYDVFISPNTTGKAIIPLIIWYWVQIIRERRRSRIALEELEFLSDHLPNCNCMDAVHFSKKSLARFKDV